MGSSEELGDGQTYDSKCSMGVLWHLAEDIDTAFTALTRKGIYEPEEMH
jgi:hypothetical protein